MMRSKSVLKNLFKQEHPKLEGDTLEANRNLKIKKKAPVDRRVMEAWGGAKLHNILNERGKPLSGRELYAYLAGNDHGQRPFNHSIRDAENLFFNNDSEKNIPEEAAQIALDHANKLFRNTKAPRSRRRRAGEIIKTLLQYAKLPSSTYDKILSSKDNPYNAKYTAQDSEGKEVEFTPNIENYVLSNPNLEEKHVLMAAENYPEHIEKILKSKSPAINSERFLNHILSRDHIFEKIPQYALFGIARWHSEGLTPTSAKKIIEHPDFKNYITHHEQLDKILDKLSPEDRKSYIDSKLGITGGEAYDPEKTGDENWDNWRVGKGYDAKVAKLISRSKHLDDSHVEHIKRHGDFDQKYDMYHKNKNIDPRHAVEMFEKWKNDDDHHGYSTDELNEKNKEEFNIYTHEDLPEEVKQEIIEEGYDNGAIDEHASAIFPYEDYLNTLNDDDILTIMGSKYDDIDEIHENLAKEYNWKVDNPNSKQNIGKADFDSLDKLAQKYDRSRAIDLDEFEEITGYRHPSEIGLPELYDKKADYIDMEKVYDKLDEYGGPSQIDYANHPTLTITDHPDYDDRFEEAANDWRLKHWKDNRYDIADENHLYENYHEHPDYEQAMEEARKSYLEENAEDHVAELYENSHQDPDFVPEHVRPHIPNFADLANFKIKKIKDSGEGKFLDKYIPKREYEHSYGENQHHYELAKDYADAKGGSIDIGTLHKIFPNQKDIWKKMFGDKGRLSSEEIQKKIDEIPKTKYDITYKKWGQDQMQNTNKQDEVVFRLDHSDDSIKALQKNPELYNTFQKIQELSQRSGHPTNKNTIAWARVDFTNPKKPMISELQSDYGKTVREYLKQNGRESEAKHIAEIEKIHSNWRENLLNAVLKAAKKHGAEKVYTHSPESKANHTGSDTIHTVYHDSYRKVPRNMGFKPVEMEEMPLTEYGKRYFVVGKEETPEEREKKHEQAIKHHLEHYSAFSQNPAFKGASDYHLNMAKNHYNIWRSIGNKNTIELDTPENIKNISHVFGAKNLSLPKDNVESAPVPHKYDELLGKPLEQPKKLQGHVYDLNPIDLKKSIELATTLIKAEILYVKKHLKNQDVIKDTVNISLIKKMLGYDNL